MSSTTTSSNNEAEEQLDLALALVDRSPSSHGSHGADVVPSGSWRWYASLLLLPVTVPFRLLLAARWYAAGSAQLCFAVSLTDTSLLMNGREWYKGWWGLLTAPFRPLPNLLILGAEKSATTSLVDWLSQHDDVTGGWISKENGMYFQGRSVFGTTFELSYRLGLPPWCQRAVDRWVFRSFFPLRMRLRLGRWCRRWSRGVFRWWTGRTRATCTKGLTGTGTQTSGNTSSKSVVLEALMTQRFPELAGRISCLQAQGQQPQQQQQETKAVIVLRDPIDRAYSHYCMLKGDNPQYETRTFQQAVDDELRCCMPVYSSEEEEEEEEQRKQGKVGGGASASCPSQERMLEEKLRAACLRGRSLQPVVDASSALLPHGGTLGLWWYDKRYLHAGRYERLVPPYLNALGTCNVIVLSFSEVVQRPRETCNHILRLVGLRPFEREGELVARVLNVSKHSDSPTRDAGAARANKDKAKESSATSNTTRSSKSQGEKKSKARALLRKDQLVKLDALFEPTLTYVEKEFGFRI